MGSQPTAGTVLAAEAVLTQLSLDCDTHFPLCVQVVASGLLGLFIGWVCERLEGGEDAARVRALKNGRAAGWSCVRGPAHHKQGPPCVQQGMLSSTSPFPCHAMGSRRLDSGRRGRPAEAQAGVTGWLLRCRPALARA
jgi:hypothetical protein